MTEAPTTATAIGRELVRTARHTGVEQRELSGRTASLDRLATYVGGADGNGWAC